MRTFLVPGRRGNPRQINQIAGDRGWGEKESIKGGWLSFVMELNLLDIGGVSAALVVVVVCRNVVSKRSLNGVFCNSDSVLQCVVFRVVEFPAELGGGFDEQPAVSVIIR